MTINNQKKHNEYSLQLQKLIQEKREKIIEICEKHGGYNVRLFGSVARGEADEKSDIDLLVDLGEKFSPWFPVRLIRELEQLLGHKVDVVTVGGLKERIKDRVLEEAIEL
ncbi:MAG: nucleotidyltransferase family protein [Halothece sp.]